MKKEDRFLFLSIWTVFKKIFIEVKFALYLRCFHFPFHLLLSCGIFLFQMPHSGTFNSGGSCSNGDGNHSMCLPMWGCTDMHEVVIQNPKFWLNSSFNLFLNVCIGVFLWPLVEQDCKNCSRTNVQDVLKFYYVL